MSSNPMRLSRRRFLHIAAVHATVLAAGRVSPLNARERVARPVMWRGIALGARVSIALYGDDEQAANEALRQCHAEVLRLEDIFSLYDARSAIGRLNRHGSLDDAPAELRELVALSRRISELTDGAFDISIQPLCELLAAKGATVSDAEIERALSRVDFRKIECDETGMRFLAPGMKLTLNGVAQGYITDRAASVLRAHGYEHTLIDLGEKRALGPHADGRPWRIGIESPSGSGLAGVLELDNRALATSGGYGNVYEPQKRHHLLDARSGISRHECASVTVTAPEAVIADVLSTSLAVLPLGRAVALLSHFPETDAWVVRAADDAWTRLS